MHPFSHNLFAAFFAATVASASLAAYAMGDEEFVGPFVNWTNVKTAYGAKGDGVTDDTAALQNALNGLQSVYGEASSAKPTLYFPAGTYLIRSTLTLTGQFSVNVIGADPATTSILWGGASGGTMLYLNGNSYSRFDRLTFNGQDTAGIAVDQSKADGTSNYFDTGNEYADDVFENAGIGLRCGNLGYGCAETSMLRDQFLNNTVAGVALKNFNALDMWIWYSLFQNNAVGVTNWSGAGNFHVYNSIFQGSTTADIGYGNTGVFNFINNYSAGSNAFISAGGTGAEDNVTIIGNTILDTTQALSVQQNDIGPVVFINNIIRTSPTAASVSIGSGAYATAEAGPAVLVGNNNYPRPASDLFSMGNTFTVGSGTCTLTSPAFSGGHCHEINDQVVAADTIDPTMPTLPGTPPNNSREIFEVTPGMSAAQIQTLINQAATDATTDKPVVHIEAGNYLINTTLVVPANSDMQIIGDGGQSLLAWNGTGTGPVIQLQGPSKAALRDFQVSGGNNIPNGIEVNNADQPGSRVFMEQAIASQSNTNLFVDGLDYTIVELHDLTHYTAQTGAPSIDVTGGPLAAQGNWQGSATNIFLGVSAGNALSFSASNGAHLSVQGPWYDSGAANQQFAQVSGPSAFSYSGSMLSSAPLSSGAANIAFDNFSGTAALANIDLTGGIVGITGTGSGAQVLGLGLGGPANVFTNGSSPAATTEFLNGINNTNYVELPEQGCCNTTSLPTTLNQLRTTQPTLLAPLPAGVTDVRMYRIFVGVANIGVHLEAAVNGLEAAINGSCGTANGVSASSAPSANLCTTGTASSLSGAGPWTWSCAGSDGGTTASCWAPVSTAANGVCGSANGAEMTSAPTSGLCSAGTASSISGSGPWSWGCAGGNGGTTASCSALLETNGACGASNGEDLTSAPTTGLCNAGTASSVSGTGPWNWSCGGSNGGTAASCSAQISSISPDGTIITAPTGSLVTSAGTWTFGPNQQPGETGQYQILLNGRTAWPNGEGYAARMEVANGGVLYTYNSYVNGWWIWTGSAWASSSAPPGTAPVNGTCGASNGATLTNQPTTNLCSAGTASSVSGTGPWSWSCFGTNGGSTASCSAQISSISPDGTIITAPTGSLVTSAGTWTYGANQQSGEPGQYQILLNGGTAWPNGEGYAAKMEVANGGVLYTYNSYVNGWWIWAGSAWAGSSAP